MWRKVLVSAALMVACCPAHAANLSAADAVLLIDRGSGEVEMFVVGISDGLEWANVSNLRKRAPQLYCLPEKLGLTNDQIISILREYVKANPKEASLPVGLVLRSAMEETFPCKASVREDATAH